MDLTLQNPWWKGKQYIKEDEDFSRWESSEISWMPGLIREITLEPFSLHFLYGARQVGKTTMVKLLIKKLLDDAVDPKGIFYFRCDQLADYKELEDVIKEYLKMKKRENITTSFIFLDEITFPKEWYRTIKWHIDMGDFKRDVLFLTGSLSMFVKSRIETFPGRRGKGKDFIMYPLSFKEFVGVVKPSLSEKIGKIKSLENFNFKIKTLYKNQPWLQELNELFELYLQSGGFPLSVKSILKENRITGDVINTYLNWVRGDLAVLKKSDSIAKRVMKAVVEKSPSPVSLHGIAKEFEVKTHKTVFEYLDLFEKLYLIKILYFIDLNKGNEIFYKERKVHLIDPFLYYIMSSWCLTSMPDKSVIVESVVASYLSRKSSVGYWRGKKELDLVVFLKNKNKNLLGIEVKWKKNPDLRRAKMGKLQKIITLTKDTFNEDPIAIPVSVFLASL